MKECVVVNITNCLQWVFKRLITADLGQILVFFLQSLVQFCNAILSFGIRHESRLWRGRAEQKALEVRDLVGVLPQSLQSPFNTI
ncbi:unnamed protein product, partial [Vitis vinifera]|uniref:Uncharacterized protein n=1 Tax=Vitis vinifera TaxID=29760 RepID=D7SSY3_VITVI